MNSNPEEYLTIGLLGYPVEVDQLYQYLSKQSLRLIIYNENIDGTVDLDKTLPKNCTMLDIAKCSLIFICDKDLISRKYSLKGIIEIIRSFNGSRDNLISTIPCDPEICGEFGLNMVSYVSSSSPGENISGRFFPTNVERWIMGLNDKKNLTLSNDFCKVLALGMGLGLINCEKVIFSDARTVALSLCFDDILSYIDIQSSKELRKICDNYGLNYESVTKVSRNNTGRLSSLSHRVLENYLKKTLISVLVNEPSVYSYYPVLLSAIRSGNQSEVDDMIQSKLQYEVAIIAIIKDEVDLEEWVSYNLLIGVDHIYIYDNMSLIPISSRLSNIVKDKITVNLFPDPPGDKLMAAYSLWKNEYIKECKWIINLSSSDYLVIKKYKTIKDLVQSYEDLDSIVLYCTIFGSNGHISRPSGLAIENYTRKTNSSSIFKVITRTSVDLLQSLGNDYASLTRVHNLCRQEVLLSDKHFIVPLDQYHKCSEIAQINHYHTKSFADWGYQIATQGTYGRKTIEEFHTIRKSSTIIDLTIIEQGYSNKILEFMKHNGLNNAVALMNCIYLPEDFDCQRYLAINTDVAKVKNTHEFAISHWFLYGNKEGRKTG